MLQLAMIRNAGSHVPEVHWQCESTYMDDMLAGGDNLKDALEVKAQMEQLFQAGGFQLSK